MKTQKAPLVGHRPFCRVALIASLFFIALATTASAQFSVSYTATQFNLFGQAHFERNPLCPDGYMIDQIGFGPKNYCTVNVTVPTSGTYIISLQMETEYPRNLYIWLGSEKGPQATGSPYLTTGDSFKTPVEYSDVAAINLQAGVNTVVFGNPNSSGQTDRCPYISQVTFSQ